MPSFLPVKPAVCQPPCFFRGDRAGRRGTRGYRASRKPDRPPAGVTAGVGFARAAGRSGKCSGRRTGRQRGAGHRLSRKREARAKRWSGIRGTRGGLHAWYAPGCAKAGGESGRGPGCARTVGTSAGRRVSCGRLCLGLWLRLSRKRQPSHAVLRCRPSSHGFRESDGHNPSALTPAGFAKATATTRALWRPRVSRKRSHNPSALAPAGFAKATATTQAP
jgi:hypothetical protein